MQPFGPIAYLLARVGATDLLAAGLGDAADRLRSQPCNWQLHSRKCVAMTTAPETDGRRTAAAARRRAREKEIIAATRGLFDQRGVRDAQIEDIARAVGINRAIVYRHFTGKEELFALTLVGYLDELRDDLAAADRDVGPTPRSS